jgi:Flp pilus assembly protein TadD
MTRARLVLSCLSMVVALAAGNFAWAAIPEPTMASVAASAEESALVADGVALHDKGQFTEAAAKYRQALEINPHNVQALYELANTQTAQKDCKGAIETAKRGSMYWSPVRPSLYMLIGSCLDDLGKGDEALEYLEAAGELQPNDYMVQYNLALTLFNAKRPAKAAECLKRGIAANPSHASSHMLLGSIWIEQGYRVPALLAFSRFLMLEREGPRAKQAAPALLQILRGWSRVESKDGGKNRTIYVEAKDPHPEEGDFSAVLMTLSMWQGISQAIPKEKRPAELEGTVLALSTAFKSIGEEEITSQAAFACKVYAPYFAEAAAKEFQETMARFILKESGLDGASKWPQKSEDKAKVKALLDWSSSFSWPKAEEFAPAPPAVKPPEKPPETPAEKPTAGSAH